MGTCSCISESWQDFQLCCGLALSPTRPGRVWAGARDPCWGFLETSVRTGLPA